MKVTFQTTFRNGLEDLQRVAADLARAQREVSSGRRVHRPSDDPAASSVVVTEAAEQRALDRYVRTADSAEARLLVVDSILSDIIARLSEAEVTASAANNSFATASQRDALALELEGIRDAVYTAITQRFRGTYLFSGAALTTPPYARDMAGNVGPYAGDGQSQVLDIDRTRTVPVTFDGSAVVGSVFDTFAQLAAAVRAGNLNGPGYTIAQGLAELRDALTRVTSAQSRVGAALRDLEEQQGRLDQARRASLERRAAVEEANLAEAISRLQQADAAHRAALGAIATVARQSLLDYLR